MLTHRGLLVHPHELDAQWLNTCVSLGLNVIGLPPPGGARANETLQSLLDLHRESGFRALLRQADAMGLAMECEMHALSWLVPRSMAAEHPDWFRMDEAGRRVADFNLCPSNREAMAYLTARAEELARLLPAETHRYYFWPDDVSRARCHCPACEGLSASDQQLIAVNAMTEAIRREIPDARVAYLAYVESIIPPTQVKPADGVFLEYAPFEKYTAPKTEEGAARIEQEAKMLVPLLDFFGRKDAKVLEYWYDNSMLSRWTKPPKKFVLDYEAMERDMAYYRDLGFSYQATFGCYLGDEYEALYNEIVDFGPFGRCLK